MEITSIRTASELLQIFLTCPDEQESRNILAELIANHATPIVQRIVSRKINRHAWGDVQNDVLGDLIGRLQTVKRSQPQAIIADFGAYAAMAAYHGCRRHYRQSNPMRHLVRSRLRYLLNNHPEFAMWKVDETGWMCGAKELWPRDIVDQRRTMSTDNGERKTGNMRPRELERVVAVALRDRNTPLPFNDLLEHVRHLSGESEFAGVEARTLQTNTLSSAVDSTVETRLGQMQGLRELWSEILLLRPAQRAALLLSMRDDSGNPALLLLTELAVTNSTEIAATLAISPEQLTQLWEQLPLDDLTIGRYLGLSRQRVINLRKSARERLARRRVASALQTDLQPANT